MKIDYDQKTEELSAADLEQMLEEYGRARSKPPSEDAGEGTDGGDAAGSTPPGPKPPGPMKNPPSREPPPVPTSRPPAKAVPVEESLLRTVIDGRYEVVRCLGTGSMGLVFLVRHMRLGKQFALKIINPTLAEHDEFAARFEREADACSRLQHPNCIHVTDFGQDADGRLFLVMEYADGTLLNQAVAEDPPTMQEALQYTKQILHGLRHAHKEGLVHRDIKMENVVKCVGDDGEAVLKILDFGMAKHPVMDNLTAAGNIEGMVMGTPQYMSPEQIRGEAVDARTDLYAVGVTLFRLISGTPVFKGESALDVFSAKVSQPAPTLAEVTGREHPPALEAFVAKALERDPAQRFASAEEMLSELETVIREVNFGAAVPLLKPVSSGGGRFGDRRRLIAVGAALLIVGAALGYWAYRANTSSADQGDADRVVSAGVAQAPPPETPGPPVSPAPPPVVPPEASPADRATTASSDGEGGDTAGAPSAAMPPTEDGAVNPALIEAALLIEKRRCGKAAKLLSTVSVDGDARTAVLLARAAVCKRDYSEALSRYREALSLDSRYRTDSGMLADAERMLSVGKVAADALAFLADDVGKPALPTIIKTASRHPVRLVRQSAREAAERLGVLSHVDLAASYEMDLNQTGSCAERREIVAAVAALGTKSARQVLIRAREAQVRENIFRTRYVHACIRPDINRALAEMKRAAEASEGTAEASEGAASK